MPNKKFLYNSNISLKHVLLSTLETLLMRF